MFTICSNTAMPQPLWYNPDTNPSQFLDALWRVRHLCAGGGRPSAHGVPGSYTLIEAIKTAIDDYAERRNRQPRVLLESAAQAG
jgi:hypothetical protein